MAKTAGENLDVEIPAIGCLAAPDMAPCVVSPQWTRDGSHSDQPLQNEELRTIQMKWVPLTED